MAATYPTPDEINFALADLSRWEVDGEVDPPDSHGTLLAAIQSLDLIWKPYDLMRLCLGGAISLTGVSLTWSAMGASQNKVLWFVIGIVAMIATILCLQALVQAIAEHRHPLLRRRTEIRDALTFADIVIALRAEELSTP